MIIRDPNPANRLGAASSGSSADRTKRTAIAGPSDRPRVGSRDQAVAGEPDNISLSNLSVRLRDLVSSAGSSQHIDRLSREYANGTYASDAYAISRGILRDAAFGF